MESELAKTKKMLQKEMCQNKMISTEMEGLLKENKNLKVKNETIMSLHKTYEEKWEKIMHNYKFFKDFYQNCLIKAIQKRLSQSFLEFFTFYFPHTSIQSLYENLDKFSAPLDKNDFNVPNERLIDFEVSEVFESNPLEHENMDSSLSKEKYQRYLAKMANELEEKYKPPTNNNIISPRISESNFNDNNYYMYFPLKGKLKRSLSNNLEYITSNKKSQFNKLFMFHNQEILNFMNFKKMMQIKQNAMIENQYFYNDNPGNQIDQEEGIEQNQEYYGEENQGQNNNYENQEEYKEF